jgi:hypothetical protein
MTVKKDVRSDVLQLPANQLIAQGEFLDLA